MAKARESFPAVLLSNGNVLVVAGIGTGCTVIAGAEVYNPTLKKWSPAALWP